VDDRTRLVRGVEAEVALACDAVTRTVANSLADRLCPIMTRFGSFARRAGGVSTLAEVTPAIAERFVTAALHDGRPASISTRHWRRTALRMLYRYARSAGLTTGDPTLDLVLPPRSTLASRPLTDDEVALCRGSSLWSLTTTRRAAVLALAEATCRTSELPHIVGADVDLGSGRVSIHGGKSTDARLGRFTDWGTEQVRRRLDELGDPSTPLVYRGQSPSGAGQVAGASALIDVLTRAGLHDETDVRPGSVAAWAGAGVLAETGRIECVAAALGVCSLDQAARIIGWDWKQADPE